MTLGQNIRRRRKALRLTVAELAARIDSDVGNLSRLERDVQGARSDKLNRLAAALNCTVSDLYADSPDVSKGPMTSAKIPLVSWEKAGALSEMMDVFQPWDAEEWIESSVPKRPRTFALRVENDSMEPDFPPGTILIVDPDLEPRPGDFIIAKHPDGDPTFKRLTVDGGERFLKPMNPQYPLRPLGEARIIGVVRASERIFR